LKQQSRYKAALLGEAAGGDQAIIVLPDDPRRVIVQKLALVVEGRPDEELDLTTGIEEIKKTVILQTLTTKPGHSQM